MYRPFALFTVFLILTDLVTKAFAEKYMQNGIELVPGFLRLRTGYNTGIAFGIPVPNSVMIVLTPLLIFAIVWLLNRDNDGKNGLIKAATALLIAGGTGNFINRIFRGAVVDFIEFSFWPAFNFADAYITVAAFLIIIFYGKISTTKEPLKNYVT